MGIFNSKEDGSLRSIAEPLAFPYQIANQGHQQTGLNRYGKNLYFAKLVPNSNIQVRGILIFCHGNCMTVNNSFCAMMQKLANFLNVIIYIPEYPGYGDAKNVGTPTAETCAMTLAQMVEYVLQNERCSSDKLYLVGNSIGTGVAVRYASHQNKYKFGGVILISPYQSIVKVVTDTTLSSSCDFYKNDKNVGDIEAPVCLIHGTNDEVINVKHSDELFKVLNKNYKNAYYRLEGLGHNDIVDDVACWKAMNQFISN